mmetsp:Transcript_3360/g.5046  ORF Transcript_3360/g.5046 Transcript_3360/m.5046 type:complete len:266 (-) Transcript_3360:34-831(-)
MVRQTRGRGSTGSSASFGRRRKKVQLFGSFAAPRRAEASATNIPGPPSLKAKAVGDATSTTALAILRRQRFNRWNFRQRATLHRRLDRSCLMEQISKYFYTTLRAKNPVGQLASCDISSTAIVPFDNDFFSTEPRWRMIQNGTNSSSNDRRVVLWDAAASARDNCIVPYSRTKVPIAQFASHYACSAGLLENIADSGDDIVDLVPWTGSSVQSPVPAEEPTSLDAVTRIFEELNLNTHRTLSTGFSKSELDDLVADFSSKMRVTM